jgi:hypothetical protein
MTNYIGYRQFAITFHLRAAWFVPPQINKWWSLGAAAEKKTRKRDRHTIENKFRDLYGHRNTIHKKNKFAINMGSRVGGYRCPCPQLLRTIPGHRGNLISLRKKYTIFAHRNR